METESRGGAPVCVQVCGLTMDQWPSGARDSSHPTPPQPNPPPLPNPLKAPASLSNLGGVRASVSACLHPVHVPRLLPPRPRPRESRARLVLGTGATLAPQLRWGIRACCSLASGVYAWPNEIAAAKELTDRGTGRIPVGPSGGKGRVRAVTPAFCWSLSAGNGMGTSVDWAWEGGAASGVGSNIHPISSIHLHRHHLVSAESGLHWCDVTSSFQGHSGDTKVIASAPQTCTETSSS